MASHHLDDEGARKGSGGIADGVHRLADHIECCVHPEAVVSACDVIVDRCRNACERNFEIVVELVERAE